MKNNIKLNILNANYWENFKFEKEIAQIYDIKHPLRVKMATECNKIIKEIRKIKE